MGYIQTTATSVGAADCSGNLDLNISTRFLTLFCLIALTRVAICDEGTNHVHEPMTVRSRPVIERVPLKVIDPVDVVITESGSTLVADRVGKVVFLVDSLQEASVLSRNLNGLSRLSDSRMMGIHILLVENGAGRVIRITETGFQSEFIELPFTPAGLAVDEVGNLWTSHATAGKVVQFDSSGERKFDLSLSEPVKDLALGLNGSAVVLLNSGKLVTVFPNETSQPSGFVPATAQRLCFHPDGFAVALTNDSRGNTSLVKATETRREADRFAGIIAGTSAFAFDRLGNLTLANPDLRAITRVTSHFEVPCPHCGTMVPMTLSPDAPAAENATRRSF